MLTDKSTIEVIKKSRKQVTILFSDIEHSTRHWERRGDIDGRMLLDRHNRLLFPIIRKFRGKIIKTLGDAIMAAFNKPDDALKAGIAIQQCLAAEREKDKYFSLHARIGIHTGKGIVEYDDIFGDVVNVAAKVESSAQANQILITHALITRVNTEDFQIEKAHALKLIGKRHTIALSICHWESHADLCSQIKPDAIMPLLKSQKMELTSYMTVALGALFFIYHFYLRFILADLDLSLSWFQPTNSIPSDYPVILILQTLVLGSFAYYLIRIDFISRTLLRALSGLFSGGLALILFASFNHYIDLPFKKRWYESVYQSTHTIVEVLKNQTPLKTQANNTADTLSLSPKGELYIQQASTRIKGLYWDKVKVNETDSAWIARKIPPAFGVAEASLTHTQKFSLQYYDIYGALIALLSFIWGFMSFSFRPS